MLVVDQQPHEVQLPARASPEVGAAAVETAWSDIVGVAWELGTSPSSSLASSVMSKAVPSVPLLLHCSEAPATWASEGSEPESDVWRCERDSSVSVIFLLDVLHFGSTAMVDPAKIAGIDLALDSVSLDSSFHEHMCDPKLDARACCKSCNASQCVCEVACTVCTSMGP